MSLSLRTRRIFNLVVNSSQYRSFSSTLTSDEESTRRRAKRISSSPSSSCPHFSSTALNAADSDESNTRRITTQTPSPPPSCPITGLQLKLGKIPSLPFVGSRLNHLFTDDPEMKPSDVYKVVAYHRENYGHFHSKGMPGFGSGLWGTYFTLTDPNEMLKVIRAEGVYPSGILQSLWTFLSVLRKEQSPMLGDTSGDNGLLGQGEGWKRQRKFLQTGMLDPRAAKGYIPGILKAAQMASGGAPLWRDDLNRYLNFCAFDMFCTFMLGEFTNCATQSSCNKALCDSESHVRNVKFCHAAIDVMEKGMSLVREPYETVMHHLRIETKTYNEFTSSWSTVREIGTKKIKNFVDRYERDELNEFERASYLANALDRLKEEGSNGVSKDEALELCLFALFVGVDTTSGVTAWNLVHMALNPNVQEKLYQELSMAIEITGQTYNGRKIFTATTLEKKNTPYLHKIIKETNRLTPPFASSVFKRASKSSITIHGETLPKDSMIALNNVFNHPRYLSDARQFKPERWDDDAVAARRGTKTELMDHPFFRDSFGQGARRCPGNRVATNEILAMIAQLVYDYKIVCPKEVTSLDDIKYDMSALITPHVPRLEFHPRKRQ